MNSIHRITLIFLLVFAFSITAVNAIGLNPSRLIVDFEPNLEKTVTYNVINNEGKELEVSIYVTGELKDYVTSKETKITVAPGETKSFNVILKLPSKLDKPGTYDTRVGVVGTVPLTASGGAQVAARVGVESQLWVRVPYPGKYASTTLDVSNVKVGEKAEFKITISNLGTEDMTVSDEVDIFDPSGTKVATAVAGSTFVKSKETGELNTVWDTKDVKPGLYSAKATVRYNGQIATADNSFNVGGLIIEIFDVAYGGIKKDSIAKFEVQAESSWNDKITGVYAELFAFNQVGNQVGKAKSESIDFGPNAKASIPIFWDTTGLPEGNYEIKFVVHYAGKDNEKVIQVEIGGGALPINIWVIAGGIGGIIVIGVLVYLMRRKPVEKKWKQRKQL